MTKQHETDPLDELRRSNPVPAERPSSASLARIRARVQEAAMNEPRDTGSAARRRTRLLVGLGAAATAAAIALVVLASGVVGPRTAPSAGPNNAVGQCVETYSLETLARRTLAFDGTVTGTSGETVTFQVNEWFRGAGGDSVTLTATGMTGGAITPDGGPSLSVGQRYLVAGEETFAWACGFTQPYEASVATQWKATLGS